MSALPIGSTIGILGGGQLGRMLASAAAQLGFQTSVYCPDASSPAGDLATYTGLGDYSDLDAVAAWGRTCDVVTYEFENVPVETAQHLLSVGIEVRPGAKALEVAQDRLVEKTFLRDCGIPTVDFYQVNSLQDLQRALPKCGHSGILKTRREGYDGKGQVRIGPDTDPALALESLGGLPAILEAFAPFECEVSAIVTRTADGTCDAFDVPRNEHENGILRRSVAPAGVSESVVLAAQEAGAKLANALDYVGVLALELFVLPGGDLVANEFAPRVHNSGHWTREACHAGQFEQHIRAIAGWPLGDSSRVQSVEMLNLLGEEIFAAAQSPGRLDSLTLYGKKDPLPGRKMGHVVRPLSG